MYKTFTSKEILVCLLALLWNSRCPSEEVSSQSHFLTSSQNTYSTAWTHVWAIPELWLQDTSPSDILQYETRKPIQFKQLTWKQHLVIHCSHQHTLPKNPMSWPQMCLVFLPMKWRFWKVLLICFLVIHRQQVRMLMELFKPHGSKWSAFLERTDNESPS